MLTSVSVVALFRKKENLFNVGYIITCFLLSVPIIYGVWSFTYSQGVPSGGDPADHVLFVLQILETGRPLIAYSQFSDAPSLVELAGVGYYPSLFHTLVAALTYVATLGSTSFASALSTMQAFIFLQYLIGIGAYSLLIKTIIDKVLKENNSKNLDFNKLFLYYGLLVLAFGLFMYSTAPIIKTFRDGGYGEIFSMWCILPFYLYFLIERRWIVSAILLAAIASTHNLSFIMGLAATLPFFAILLIDRDFNALRRSKNFLLVFLVLFLPALIFFYAPNALSATNAGVGQAEPVPRDYVLEQVKPLLYYGGLVGSISILFLNYKKLGWLTGWGLLYFPVFNSAVFAERFARELSLTFGLIVGVVISIGVWKLLRRICQHFDNKEQSSGHAPYQIIQEFVAKRPSVIVVSLIIVLLPLSYLYFSDRFQSFSDPLFLNYYDSAIAESNIYLANQEAGQADGRTSAVLFGVNPWLKPATYDRIRILEVLPIEDEKYLSALDRGINKNLRAITEDPTSQETINIIRKYNIHYVVISDLLPGRWYPTSYIVLDSRLDAFDMAAVAPYAELVNSSSNDGVHTRVYLIDHDKLLPN